MYFRRVDIVCIIFSPLMLGEGFSAQLKESREQLREDKNLYLANTQVLAEVVVILNRG